jgi:hypothetical protein
MGAVIVEYSLRSCFTNPVDRAKEGAKERAREREKAKNSSSEKILSDFGRTYSYQYFRTPLLQPQREEEQTCA